MGMNYLNWKSGKKDEKSAIAQDESLAEHDKKYHPEGFDPKKDECKLRETMAAEGKKDEIESGEKKTEEAKLPTVGEFVTLKADGKKYEIVEDLGEGNYWLKSDNPNQNGNGTFGVNAKEHLEGIKYLEQKAAKEKAANDKAVAEFTERRNEIVKSDVYKKIMAASDFSKSPRKAYEQKRIVKNSLPVMNQHAQREMGRKLGFTYTENGMDFGDQRVIDAIVKMLPANASKKDIERFAVAVQEDVVAACGIEGKYEGPYATDDCIRHALPEDHSVRKLFEDK